MREYYVYILKCVDGSLYTGVTNDYQRRFKEHQDGLNPSCYTYKRRPVELVHVSIFRYVLDAIAFEKQLKGWSRKKKEALIAKDIEQLKKLAKKDFGKHRCQSE
jgi:putative endonuclease